MRRLFIKSTLLLLLYTLVNLYFAAFNWKIFSVKLNIDLGFTIVEFPPFIALFLAGFLLIGILSWINYTIRVRKLILDLEQGVEIGRLKDRLMDKKIRNLVFDENTLKILKEKMGIKELFEKTEELTRLVSELGQKPLKQ